jgi:hypothetical protein
MLINLKDAARTLISTPVVNEISLMEIKIPKAVIKELELTVLNGKAIINERTSFVPTSEARATGPSNYAIFPNQFFVLAINLFPFAKELIKYFYCLELFRSQTELLRGDSEEIKSKIYSSELKNKFDSDLDIELFAKFVDSTNDEFRLSAKSPVNIKDGRVVLRASEDCFGSVILTQVNIPNSSSSIFGDLIYSLVRNEDLVERLSKAITSVVSSGFDRSQSKFYFIPKPFLLLAGISGTGKSRFVREQAAASGSIDETYKLISVRPDWHEPSDLLGYISRLKSGDAEYIVMDALRFMVAAWSEAWDSTGATSAAYLPIKSPEDIRPYWLCLDEMNLAPVEQYFADYLSVIETRKWDEGIYSCDPIIKSDTILQLSDASQEKLRADLGIEAANYDALWAFFIAKGKGIPLPPNLIVAGTVNMDETTHGFSRKVIDRALSFDFGEFFPNDFDYFFSPDTQNLALTYPLWSDASKSLAELSTTFDADGKKTIAFMSAVNAVLDNTPFKLAYRALNEILLSVIASNPQDERNLMAVWDDFIMCKVLPRIEGDADKLAVLNSEGASDKSLLTELLRVLTEQFHLIWEGEVRPDLYRKYKEEKTNLPVGVIDNPDNRKTIWIECRAKRKLVWMQLRLTNATFTSFWP